METITNAASAVSHAIFGGDATTSSNNQEPVNGALGDTTKGEPYDAGNTGYSTETEKTNPETNTSVPDTTANTTELPVRPKAEENTNDKMSSTIPISSADAPGNTTSTNPIQPELEHDKTGITNAPEPSSAFTSDKPSSSNEPSTSGPEPSISADLSSAVQRTPKQQGADRPEETPNSEEHDRIKEVKKEAEKAQNADVNGPGPVPLEEAGKKGGAAGDDDGIQKESVGEGTGEKYVKSSGLKADGGDFDAANPGAGKEADRLLEEKGIHHTTPATKSTDDTTEPSEDTSAAEPGKKPSLKEKIKAKLHKH